MNETRNPVAKGVYNCEIVSGTRSAKSNHADHYVMSIRLKPLDCGVENPCEYFAELPMLFKTGANFNFYDREKGASVTRKCTSADSTAAIEYARKCIPAWGEYIDALPEGSSYADAFKWFDEPHEAVVRAAVKDPREYNGKLYYEATIYEWRSGKSAVEDADSFNAEFGSIIKAAGLKFGGAGAKAKATPAAKVATATKAHKAPPPPAPAASKSGLVYTAEDSWNAYESSDLIKRDPRGANYWPTVEKIVGKPTSAYESFTSEDWRKCVEAFALPF